MVKLAVIGAGINGLASAIKIKEQFGNFEVVLISKEFTPNTTGDGSGGVWLPYLCGNTPEYLLAKWGSTTFDFLLQLWKEGGFNICIMPLYHFFGCESLQRPLWADKVLEFEMFDERQIDYYNRFYKSKYRSGYRFTTIVAHPPTLLQYLTDRFTRAGGKLLKSSLSSFSDSLLEDYDVIVNCTGLGSKELVPDDGVFPIRGQILKVIAPWMKQVVIDEDSGNYIIPNVETCVLGGTHQEHNYNQEVDQNDTNFIINGCKKLVPGLEHAAIVKNWVGLRPGRQEIRLESEEMRGKLFIHNYGHGGSGLTLFWGCAENVLDILKKHLNTRESVKCKI